MIDFPIPAVGISAFSGTGKTTLLAALIPRLKAMGLKIGVLKHAHHDFDLDQPGKDSYQLRKAGASETIICTYTRMARISEFDQPADEPSLPDLVAAIDPARVDLLLIEGYKHLKFPKIELHRPDLGHPLLCNDDDSIIAIACDADFERPRGIPVLDLNNADAIAAFIHEQVYLRFVHPT